MDKETKRKLREAGWSEEGIVELEMEEKKVTITKERYEELIHKEDLLEQVNLSDAEVFESLKEKLIADMEDIEKELAEVQQPLSKGDRELVDKVTATDKWEDLFEAIKAMGFDVSQAVYLIFCAYGIEPNWEFPLQGWST